MASLPGPKSPADYDSFLMPIVSELKDLETNGISVKTEAGDIINAKVHLLNATGDIPAVTAISKHAGHASIDGCRICKDKAVRCNNGRYMMESGANLRDVNDYTYGNPVSISLSSLQQ